MLPAQVAALATALTREATPVLRISGVEDGAWRRNVARGPRVGPWKRLRYTVLNDSAWRAPGACLYLVVSNRGTIQYAGISLRRLKDRWRLCPAFDAASGQRLPGAQLFHSQCQKHLEQAFGAQSDASFEVRVIYSGRLQELMKMLGFDTAAAAPGEDVVTTAEKWLRTWRSPGLVPWNVA